MSPTMKNAARSSRNSTALNVAARAGFAVNGAVNAVIGIIAIGIAVSGGGSADQSGAFGAIASNPGGLVALWVMAVALGALGLWYLIAAFFVTEQDTKKRVAAIVVSAGKGIAYLALAAAAVSFATGGGSDSSEQSTSFTATLMASPGGIILIVLIGLVFCGIGAYMVHKGATKGFEEDLVMPGGTAGKGVRVLGMFGYIARGIALFIVGVLFIVAAFTVDPEKATGLDGALKALAALPFGQVLLALVGLGFIAYGAYSVARAKLARLN
ncbi:DUF1206 domain-containing protein [Glaciihabitans arcticus]|uniref:DUF1206 domain-containing protein n=1 Tax=Glaciihabitans arcticus TaxID=2668039 RepID=A0A4V2JF72_9MICO|nr:DUF1206 domain-containing protein [Glaciihabitans arcticus]TBN58339.1 DUF1206 domain-containing protein [Glaciihabitans arcticus]